MASVQRNRQIKFPFHSIGDYLSKNDYFFWKESNQQSIVSNSSPPMENQQESIHYSYLLNCFFLQLFCFHCTLSLFNNLPTLTWPLCPSTTKHIHKQSTHVPHLTFTIFPLFSKCIKNFLPWTIKIHSIFETSMPFSFLLDLVIKSFCFVFENLFVFFCFQKKSLGSRFVKHPS